MRYVLIVFIVLFFAVLASADMRCPANLIRQQKIIREIEEILKKKAAPRAVPAHELAPAIFRASTKYNLDYRVLTAVILVESRGVSHAYNPKSHDHGLGQINEKTARAMGISMTCLYSWKCNLDAMSQVLSNLNKYRLCRYNVGTGSLQNEKLLYACQRYEQRVAGMQ